jgi:hypothetical protein
MMIKKLVVIPEIVKGNLVEMGFAGTILRM